MASDTVELRIPCVAEMLKIPLIEILRILAIPFELIDMQFIVTAGLTTPVGRKINAIEIA